MVHRTLRKRRSKRSMKRSIKRYRRHAKTRIRRNMYRKKNKKTQRGGVNFSDFLPNGLKFSTKSGIKRELPSDLPYSHSPPASPPPPVNKNEFHADQENFDIGDSTDKNKLDGKRILKAKILSNLLVSHNSLELFVDDDKFSFYQIDSVTKTEGGDNIIVSAKKIMDKDLLSGNITLSKRKYIFTLKQSNEQGKYDVVNNSYGTQGVVSHKGMRPIFFTISNFTVTDLETIETGYVNYIANANEY